MIKTLSPYYISIPLVNPNSLVVCQSYTINLFIWSGNKTSVPSVPDYEITKINAAASNGTDKIDIARIVNDFIDFNCIQSTVTSLENGLNQVWVKFVAYYNDEPTLAQLVTTQIATKGYGYFMEGENPQIPTNKILLEGDEFKVSRNGFFVLPIMMNETTPPTPTLVIDSVTLLSGDSYEIQFTTNISYTVIYFQYSPTTLNTWTIGDEEITADPFTITIPSIPGTYDVQIFTYDPLTDAIVYSNIYVLVIP